MIIGGHVMVISAAAVVVDTTTHVFGFIGEAKPCQW